MEYDVFIGYSRKDSDAAEKIERYLSKAGFRCWRDKTLIPGSAEWVEAIAKAIDGCYLYIAVVSENSANSKYVARELMMADAAGRKFLPVVLSDRVRLSPRMRFLFSELQHIHAVPTLDQVLPEVLDAVSKAVDREKNKSAYDDEAAVVEHSDYHWVSNLKTNTEDLHVGADECGTTTAEQGAYVMTAKPGMYLGRRIQIPNRMSDFIIEARISKLDGPDDQWFGFEYRDEPPGNYCQFLFSGQGAVRVAKLWNKEWNDLDYRPNLPQAETGNSLNTLKIVRKGDSFHIFVNHLFVTTVGDADIRLGKIGLIIGKGLRVAFADLRIDGMTLDTILQEAIDHWHKLEISEARQLLKHLLNVDPSNSRAARLLNVFCPDYRESVLVVIGYQMLPQIHDSMSAFILKGEINRRGRPHELRFSCVVTDMGLLEEDVYMRCPVISIGGPEANKITARFADELPADPSSTECVRIHHNIDKGIMRVALWGTGSLETGEAVKSFIYSGLLDRFLDLIWGQSRTQAPWGSSSA